MTSFLPPVVLPKQHGVAAQPSVHDEQVVVRINSCIDRAYEGILRNRGGADLATESLVLEKAQCTCMNERKGPLDLVGRDAEYYLKLRWRVSEEPGLASKVGRGLADAFANGSYNLLKAAMIGAGLEEYMRTDPEVMVTSPGGVGWGAKGSIDGLSDVGTRKGKPAKVTLPRPDDTMKFEMA
jgi:hypothetical protein